MTVVFTSIGLFGLRLLPLLRSHRAATADGLHIFDRHLKEQLSPWGSIYHGKDWRMLQVIDIYSEDGSGVLSVDYYISNFWPPYQQVLERTPTSA